MASRRVGQQRQVNPLVHDHAWLGWVLFAAIIVTLVNWFVVLPIKGAPMGGGFRMPVLVVVPIVYGFWGLGMWLIARGTRAALSWR